MAKSQKIPQKFTEIRIARPASWLYQLIIKEAELNKRSIGKQAELALERYYKRKVA